MNDLYYNGSVLIPNEDYKLIYLIDRCVYQMHFNLQRPYYPKFRWSLNPLKLARSWVNSRKKVYPTAPVINMYDAAHVLETVHPNDIYYAEDTVPGEQYPFTV